MINIGIVCIVINLINVEGDTVEYILAHNSSQHFIFQNDNGNENISAYKLTNSKLQFKISNAATAEARSNDSVKVENCQTDKTNRFDLRIILKKPAVFNVNITLQMKTIGEEPFRGFRIIRAGPANQSDYDLGGCCYPISKYSRQKLGDKCDLFCTSPRFKKMNSFDGKPSVNYTLFRMTHTFQT